jgi:hypothetical protein
MYNMIIIMMNIGEKVRGLHQQLLPKGVSDSLSG